MPAINAEVLIVGAGLTGLIAARALKKAGVDSVLLDKGEVAGGRLDTRRVGTGLADVGAQFFTVRTPEFRAHVSEWLDRDIAYLWSMGWSMGSLTENVSNGHPRYAIRGGMANLARHLMEGLEVHLQTQVSLVYPCENSWMVECKGGRQYRSQALVLTPPVPLCLELLDAGQVELSPEQRGALERIRYSPCLAGMFWVQGAVRIPRPGGVQRPAMPIPWVADNQQKGISPDAAVFTVHAGPEYSRRLWNASQWEMLKSLQSGLEPYLDSDSVIVESLVRRWRFAVPESIYGERCMLVDGLPFLIFAGDAFGGPRMEGATLSGLATAEALLGRASHEA